VISQAAPDPSAAGLHIRADLFGVFATRLNDLARMLVALLAVLSDLRAACVGELIPVVFQALYPGTPSRLHITAQSLHIFPAGASCGASRLLSTGSEAEEHSIPRHRREQYDSRQIPHDSSPIGGAVLGMASHYDLDLERGAALDRSSAASPLRSRYRTPLAAS